MSTYDRFMAAKKAEEMRMFHWRDNTYFGRLPGGFVRVVKFSRPPHVMWFHNESASTVPTDYPRADGEFYSVDVLLDIRISPDEWASIIASVSGIGESNGGWDRARKFHTPPYPGDEEAVRQRIKKEGVQQVPFCSCVGRADDDPHKEQCAFWTFVLETRKAWPWGYP